MSAAELLAFSAVVLASASLALLAAPVLASCLYLLALTLLSAAPAWPGDAPRPSGQPRLKRRHRFEVIVPAHDEAGVIGAVLASLQRLAWPAADLRLTVVADNCSDATATLARAAGTAGGARIDVRVLERHDPLRRGKGHALAHAFAQSQAEGWADAWVVVDADSAVTPNLLHAFALRIERGAQVMQADHAVLNARDSARTRLMAIALGAFHRLRSRARERLGLSCGLRGNGWCLTRRVLAAVPYQAFSLAEDIEYGITLGLAGQRVHHVDEAAVAGLMVSHRDAAASQRRRWEDGRYALIRSHTGRLLRSALGWAPARAPDRAMNELAQGGQVSQVGRVGTVGHGGTGARRRVCLDLALDLLVLPLSQVAAGVVGVSLLALGAMVLAPLASGPAMPLPEGVTGEVARQMLTWLTWLIGLVLGLMLLSAASLVAYVLRGWQLCGVGRRGLVDLLRAPAFVAWKLWLMLRSHERAPWVRTHREQP